ncbi:MAG: tetratricopeptide repeat protein [Bacteroidota bacterium]|nr:MAG: tetratricopeptide repeat protein [Bacteroidota bacterium]
MDSLLGVLDEEISNKNLYHQKKVYRIDSLKKSFIAEKYSSDNNYRYKYDEKLFNEYKYFISDSAFAYATKTLAHAFQVKNPERIAAAKLNLSFTLLSSGLFTETLDTLLKIDARKLSDSIRAAYFSLLGRTYFDLADYSQDIFYTPLYEKEGQECYDSALMFTSEGSQAYYLFIGLKNLRLGNITHALRAYNYLLTEFILSEHDMAVVASSMAHLYRLSGKHNEADFMLAQSAIADLRSSTKETTALRNLAEHLFQEGEVERAYNYVNIALDDAYFYEARHRKLKISEILPLIEKERMKIAQKQRQVLIRYSILTSILVLLVLFLTGVVLRQIRRLKKTRNDLAFSYDAIQQTNFRLHEVNRIKEEYIGHFFKVYSDYIEKFDKLKKSVGRKLTTNSYQDIADLMRNIDLKMERETLYADFDKSFLKIFPNFLVEFNRLFKDEDRFVLDEHHMLSPEIRIFALIRLGIKDNEKLAQVLNYSLNTIYTYKTKVKNKSLVSNDDFESKVMEIQAV